MAKRPKVKCPVCNQQFYREDVDYIPEGRRYYHKECYEQKIKNNIQTNHEQDVIDEIYDYCLDKFGESYSRRRITRQLKKYVEEGMTYENILMTLKYWYEIKDGDPEKAMGGIGIVGYIYDDAVDWKNNQNKIKDNLNNANIESIINSETEHFIIKDRPIRKPKRVKLFKLG